MRLQRLFSGMLVLGVILPVSAIALPHSIPVMKDDYAQLSERLGSGIGIAGWGEVIDTRNWEDRDTCAAAGDGGCLQ